LEILALELREAVENLGHITGHVFTDDLLDRMFSRFCVGK
jgi:tRNA modification GTPase